MIAPASCASELWNVQGLSRVAIQIVETRETSSAHLPRWKAVAFKLAQCTGLLPFNRPSKTDDTISNQLLEALKLLPMDLLQMLSFRSREPFPISKDDSISHLASLFRRPVVNSSKSASTVPTTPTSLRRICEPVWRTGTSKIWHPILHWPYVIIIRQKLLQVYHTPWPDRPATTFISCLLA